MNLSKEIENLLTENPIYRERKNKNKFIARWLQKKYPHELESISLQRLEDIVVDASSVDRYWRLALQNNEEIRGSDYNDKTALQQEKILDLGYEPIKKIKV